MIGAIGGQGSDMLKLWREKLAAADTDQSGGLSLDEFTKLGQGDKTKKTDASGKVAPDPAEMFAKLDANGDGQLSADETAKPPRPHGGHGPPPLGGAAMSLLLGEQEDDASAGVDSLVSQLASKLIDAADTNGDGTVSAEEYAAKTAKAGDASDSNAVASQFAAADADGNGALSADELSKQLQDSLKQQMEAGGRQAYDKLLSVFSDAVGSQASAKTSSAVSISA